MWKGYYPTEKDSLVKYNRRLSVHHKSYNNIYAEDFDQLVTLCDSCHKGKHTKALYHLYCYYRIEGVYSGANTALSLASKGYGRFASSR